MDQLVKEWRWCLGIVTTFVLLSLLIGAKRITVFTDSAIPQPHSGESAVVMYQNGLTPGVKPQAYLLPTSLDISAKRRPSSTELAYIRKHYPYRTEVSFTQRSIPYVFAIALLLLRFQRSRRAHEQCMAIDWLRSPITELMLLRARFKRSPISQIRARRELAQLDSWLERRLHTERVKFDTMKMAFENSGVMPELFAGVEELLVRQIRYLRIVPKLSDGNVPPRSELGEETSRLVMANGKVENASGRLDDIVAMVEQRIREACEIQPKLHDTAIAKRINIPSANQSLGPNTEFTAKIVDGALVADFKMALKILTGNIELQILGKNEAAPKGAAVAELKIDYDLTVDCYDNQLHHYLKLEDLPEDLHKFNFPNATYIGRSGVYSFSRNQSGNPNDWFVYVKRAARFSLNLTAPTQHEEPDVLYSLTRVINPRYSLFGSIMGQPKNIVQHMNMRLLPLSLRTLSSDLVLTLSGVHPDDLKYDRQHEVNDSVLSDAVDAQSNARRLLTRLRDYIARCPTDEWQSLTAERVFKANRTTIEQFLDAVLNHNGDKYAAMLNEKEIRSYAPHMSKQA
ncbi:hypothetical protein [Aliagarivorans taiwanensis]|uniref:hypothetical protein n=1 Tax=Aliagarivorans taiwanensis TaxID=561966 RepID=UPI0012F859E3|nr:hypothetical protein [Aliagarivorans taiwanensis]